MTPADPRAWEERDSDRAFADFLSRCRFRRSRHRVVVFPAGGVCPPEHGHGRNVTCYTHGCRCDECRTTWVEEQYARRARTRAGYPPAADIDAQGTRRRIEALIALGWPVPELAARLEVTRQRVQQLMRSELVEPATAARVGALFDELWDQRPEAATPEQQFSIKRALSYARRRGFALPLAWDDIDADEVLPVDDVDPGAIDETAVALAVAGDVVELTPVERRAAVRVLHSERMNDWAIAARLRCSERTVLRIRQELGLPEVFGQIEWRPRPSSTREAA